MRRRRVRQRLAKIARSWSVPFLATLASGFIIWQSAHALRAQLLHVRVDFVWVAVSFLLYGAFMWLRGLRLELLMKKPPRFLTSLAVGSTYTLGCSLLPGGLGEFVLPIIYRRTDEAAEASVSIMIARIQDLSSWIAIILVGSLFVHLHAFAGKEAYLMAASAAIIAVLCALLVVSTLRLRLIRWCLHLPVAGRYETFLFRIHDGLKEQWHNLPSWLVTLALRAVMIGAYLSLLAAIGVHAAFADMAIAGGLVALLLVIPVQGVGGLGTTELWWLVAFGSLGLAGSSGGLLGAVMLHVPPLIYSVLVGVMGMYLFRAKLGRAAA